MRSKKLVALGLASMMLLSTTTVAFAADASSAPATGSIAGDGGIVGYIDKEVFTVTLPTTSDVNFTIDPQELKLATDATFKVDDNTAQAGYGAKVLFENANKNSDGYATKSKAIAVVNKSTFDVDVKLDAKVTGLSKAGEYDIKMVDDVSTAGTDTAMSLKITPTTGTSTKGAAISSGTVGTAVTLNGTAEGVSVVQKVDTIEDPSSAVAYEVGTDGSGGYVYKLKDNVESIAFEAVEFNLSGEVNTAADWSKFNEDGSKALKVELTYTIDKHVEGPQVTMSADGLITITGLTATKNLATMDDITLTADGTTYSPSTKNSTWNGDSWTADNGGSATVQLATSWGKGNWNDKSVVVKVKLKDGTTISSSAVTLNMQ